MADYEIWLADDSGRRLRLITQPAFLTYTRAVDGLATSSFGVPLALIEDLKPYFRPDWRAEIWRSPQEGTPKRLEDTFLLRKHTTYTRRDNVQIVQYYGRNGVDLLKRRTVAQRAGTSYALKSGTADDLMKAYVRQQMLYGSALDKDGAADNTRAWPQNEFKVQADGSLGPTLTRDFADRFVFDLCKDLVKAAQQKYDADPTQRRIHFDVVPVDVSGLATANSSTQGWEFRTYADLRGADRTQNLEFSQENENAKDLSYSLDHLDEATLVWAKGNGSGASQLIESISDTNRLNASRWNRVEVSSSATNEPTTAGLQDAGRVELGRRRPEEKLTCTFLNTPGGAGTPRSLYGVDWDLGDQVRVNYAGQQFNVEIMLVYVSVNEDGKEELTGRSTIQ